MSKYKYYNKKNLNVFEKLHIEYKNDDKSSQSTFVNMQNCGLLFSILFTMHLSTQLQVFV